MTQASENDRREGAAPELEWHAGDMPYSPAFGDYFYSRADGRAESFHVFIDGNGLVRRFAEAKAFTIAETGFGTGLNFIEAWRAWKAVASPEARLDFVSFEKYPMEAAAMARALSAWPELAGETAALAGVWPAAPRSDVEIDFGRVRLMVVIGEAAERIAAWDRVADAWFLDGFAPSRNPDMWSEELLSAVGRHTAPGGTFATYTAAGWVRRNLAAAGFEVRKLPGFAGKRDMSAGILPPAATSEPASG